MTEAQLLSSSLAHMSRLLPHNGRQNWLNKWAFSWQAACSSVRRIFERGKGAKKFENNEDQKKFLHSESVRFSAQN